MIRLLRVFAGDVWAFYARVWDFCAREYHHGYAIGKRLPWLTCPLCSRPFGGHEVHLFGPCDTIPNPCDPIGDRLTICPPCACAGRGIPDPPPREADPL